MTFALRPVDFMYASTASTTPSCFCLSASFLDSLRWPIIASFRRSSNSITPFSTLSRSARNAHSSCESSPSSYASSTEGHRLFKSLSGWYFWVLFDLRYSSFAFFNFSCHETNKGKVKKIRRKALRLIYNSETQKAKAARLADDAARDASAADDPPSNNADDADAEDDGDMADDAPPPPPPTTTTATAPDAGGAAATAAAAAPAPPAMIDAWRAALRE